MLERFRLTVPSFMPRRDMDHDANIKAVERAFNAIPIEQGEWTPILSQPGNLSLSSAIGEWYQVGTLVTFTFHCVKSATGTGTAGGHVGIEGWPARFNPIGDLAVSPKALGAAYVSDASGSDIWAGTIVFFTTTVMAVAVTNTTSALWGQDPSIGLASGDVVSGEMRWRVA
jgi:hypothetical protein